MSDGRADLATYRPTTGEWFLAYSGTGFTTFDVLQGGAPGDVPAPHREVGNRDVGDVGGLLLAPEGLSAQSQLSVIHNFTLAEGSEPREGLVEGADGNFYGTHSLGGQFDRGTIFRMTPEGVVTVLHAFRDGVPGAAPNSLMLASDGHFYGTTTRD